MRQTLALSASVSRRRVSLCLALCLIGCKPAASQQHALSAEDEALKRKFRGLEGGELYVDSLVEIKGFNIFDEFGRVFYASAVERPRGNFRGSYSGDFGVPKTLRFVWREGEWSSTRAQDDTRPESDFIRANMNGTYTGGKIAGDYTVPVAARIPEEVLNDWRQNGGGFRLKIRMHADGPLIGWDIVRARGSAPDGSSQFQVGGDFREAPLIYKRETGCSPCQGKGWFIHPKTKERIETDF
jgi:hypothetical protein